MTDRLKVLQLNCQGLNNQNYLETLDADIVILNETKVTNKDKVKFSRWNVAASVEDPHHGTLVCSKKGITYVEEEKEKAMDNDYIRIKFNKLTVSAVYVKPDCHIPKTKLNAHFTTEHLIIGYINAHNKNWGSSKDNMRNRRRNSRRAPQ